MGTRPWCVVGAGAGGLATAAHLSRLGLPVVVFNRSWERIAPVARSGGIETSGLWSGRARVVAATADPACVREADRIVVATPATAHGELAAMLAPHLTSRHLVVLHPGRTLGAVEFARALGRHGGTVGVVAETDTLLYTCRSPEPGHVRVMGLKTRVKVAALPSWRTREAVEALRVLGPFVPAASVLETGLANMGAMLHPAPMLLNAARIEAGPPFEYYREGMTAAVLCTILGLDRERLAVARQWGVRAEPLPRWLRSVYDVPRQAQSLGQLLRANPAYAGVMSPPTLFHRYLLEDVPTGLVPMAELARLVGLRTPLIQSVIDVASGLLGVDFRETGRTMSRLGLGDASAGDLARWVLTGDVGLSEPVSAR